MLGHKSDCRRRPAAIRWGARRLCCIYQVKQVGTGRGTGMQFGYFTLSDNHYLDNRRGAIS